MTDRSRIRALSTLASLALPALIACDGGSPQPAADTGKTDGAKAQTAKADGVKPGAAEVANGEADPDAAKTAAADKAVADKQAKARAAFAETDEAKIVAARAKMVVTLNEGRKLVKAGDLDAGIVKYRELLVIDPHYGPALGELGWAEFKAGRYDSAEEHTLKALGRAPDDKRRGMLHYNLGRIAEAQDQTEAAIEAYALSLTLRPNEVVAGRLAALSHVESAEGVAAEHPAVEAYEAAHAEGAKPVPVLLQVERSGLANIEAVCAALLPDNVDDDESCELLATPSSDATWGVLALDSYGIERYWRPVVKTDAGWSVFEVALYGQHGSEIDQDVDHVASHVVTNEAGSYLFIEYSDHTYERDWSWGELEEDEEIPDSASEDSKGVIICKRGPALVCAAPISTEWNYWFGDEHDEYSASVSMKGDTIVIGDVVTLGTVEYSSREYEWDPVRPLPAGEYAFADLK